MVYLGLPIKNGDYPGLCEITRWYMFPKFGGNMCIDATAADDTQEKTSRFAQANLNALQVRSTEIWVSLTRVPPYPVVNHHCPYETCNLEGAPHF